MFNVSPNHFMRIEKRFLAALVAVAILFVGFRSNLPSKGIDYASRIMYAEEDGTILDKYSTFEKEWTDTQWGRKEMIELNGTVLKKLGVQTFYKDIGINVTDDGYSVGIYPETSTDYEYDQLVSLKAFLDENDIKLLYVNQPVKYIDDQYTMDQFGKQSYVNRNADKLLSRLKKAGIDCVDIRDSMRAENKDIKSMYYKADQHMTVPAGMWATEKLAEGLNKYCDYEIDTSLYDSEKYNFTEYEDVWLGEQGRKAAATYTGLEDYTVVTPKFETHYTIKDNGESATFDDFLEWPIFISETDLYDGPSWHYAYHRVDCINEDVEKGKILVLGDSYSHVTVPFLSLGVHELDSLIIRFREDDYRLRDVIKDGGYDTVVVSYASFMIGAHDDPENANKDLFTFDP